MSMEFADPNKKERKPLPDYAILIIVLGTIFLIIGIVRSVLNSQINQTFKELTEEHQSPPSSTEVSSFTIAGVIPVSYRGVSIKIPANWEYSTEEMQGGMHQLLLGSSVDDDYTVIVWGKDDNTFTLRERAQALHDSGREYDIFSPGELKKTLFFGQEAYTLDYYFEKTGIRLYARSYIFSKNGDIFHLMNYTTQRSHLNERYGFVEKTFSVN